MLQGMVSDIRFNHNNKVLYISGTKLDVLHQIKYDYVFHNNILSHVVEVDL